MPDGDDYLVDSYCDGGEEEDEDEDCRSEATLLYNQACPAVVGVKELRCSEEDDGCHRQPEAEVVESWANCISVPQLFLHALSNLKKRKTH